VSIIVQKFGGTSVATSERIMAAARRAIRARQEGHQVVMVVSARGDTTDELIALAREITEEPPARELDMLLSTGEQVSIALMAMAVQSLGHPAVSLTGAQVGIVTDHFHTKARIKSVSTERIRQLLDRGHIVIVAGFQGVDESQNITTLGRGGSDTTAVALAAALDADLCEIYTDVDGVYTTDPRLVPEARKIERISYDEMLELASAGAAVMHSRSIELAKKFNVPIHVRSSFTDAEGTWIVPSSPDMEAEVVRGAALVRDEARVTIEGVPDRPSAFHTLFARIAEQNITTDMIVQNVPRCGLTQVSFTVARGDLKQTLAVAKEVAREIGAGQVHHEDSVSKLSIVGIGMKTHTGVAERMFAALAAEGINIKMITTSEIKISVLVDRDRAVEALRAVHRAFELGRPRAAVAGSSGPAAERRRDLGRPAVKSLANLVRQLPSMEAIVVSSLALDRSQGRVTFFDIPDRPGIAARIFGQVSRAGAVVDMIVQNVSTEGLTHLSFTVPKEDLTRVRLALEEVRAEIGGSIGTDAHMAKITLEGVGMRSHTGVVARMFEAFAGPEIKVHMVNTSEIDVSIAVTEDQADEALRLLRGAFHLTAPSSASAIPGTTSA
jgi:aspartate kinase